MIDAVVSSEQFMRAQTAVFARHASSEMTALEWLKTPSARRSPSTMTETLAKIGFLKGLGAHTRTFDAVPIEKQRAYGQRIQADPEAAPSASHGAAYFTPPRPCPNPLGLSCCGLQH